MAWISTIQVPISKLIRIVGKLSSVILKFTLQQEFQSNVPSRIFLSDLNNKNTLKKNKKRETRLKYVPTQYYTQRSRFQKREDKFQIQSPTILVAVIRQITTFRDTSVDRSSSRKNTKYKQHRHKIKKNNTAKIRPKAKIKGRVFDSDYV